MGSTRIFAFGAGVQSHAVMVLQAQGKLDEPFDIFLFANVGNDSENPDTVKFFNEHTIPYAKKHGIRLEICQKMYEGKPDTIHNLIKRTPLSMPLPMWYRRSGKALHSCSVTFKQQPQDRWIKQHGYGSVIVGIGYSIDEFTRARNENWAEHPMGFLKRFEQPLLHMRLTRYDCHKIISESELPVPPKSACWFCPITQIHEWERMKINNPELFQKAVELERFMNAKHNVDWPDENWRSLHRHRLPLDIAVGFQPELPMDYDDELCGGSSCMT
jgi:hypothetical protein